MRCVFCLSADVVVIDSRWKGGLVTRRRLCQSCSRPYRTEEILSLSKLKVIEEGPSIQKFSEAEILCSIRDVDSQHLLSVVHIELILKELKLYLAHVCCLEVKREELFYLVASCIARHSMHVCLQFILANFYVKSLEEFMARFEQTLLLRKKLESFLLSSKRS